MAARSETLTFDQLVVRPFRLTTSVFDTLKNIWENQRVHRWTVNILVFAFLGSLFVIELSRQGLLPKALGPVPANHFYAVKLAFDLLLVIEVLGLVFGLAESVADAMGKQFEILSLILLRQSFKEFTSFAEPLNWDSISDSVLHILSDAGGALVIFWLVLLYYRLQKHRKITDVQEDLISFVAVKKMIALVLLFLFVAVGLHNLLTLARTGEGYSVFSIFFLILIFSDILIVLISLRYSKIYGIVFRNSGFAVATVLIRLALTAPAYVNILLGVAAVWLGIGLTMAHNYFQILPQAVEADQDRTHLCTNWE